jgi:hypothetical protein
MKFVAYLSCLSEKSTDSKKSLVLGNFTRGVAICGDEIVLHTGRKLIDADVAMILGYVHENSRNTPHLMLRKSILEHQLKNKKRTILADSNLFLYKNKDNPFYYLRYSFDGIFPNTGEYCDGIVDSNRWRKISSKIGIGLKDYRTNGNHILMCLQRNGGWSMGGFDVIDWTAQTIKLLRLHTDREIVIRAHPGDKGSKNYLSQNNLIKKIGLLKGVRLSKPGATLLDDLKNCWAVVNYNSSPTVAAAIEGYPIFVTDAQRSQCADIANTNLKNIESPMLPDRQRWVERISMFHWSFEEAANGECWNHMRNFV